MILPKEPESPREKLEGKPDPGNVPTQAGAESATAGATGATHPSGVTGERTGKPPAKKGGVEPEYAPDGGVND